MSSRTRHAASDDSRDHSGGRSRARAAKRAPEPLLLQQKDIDEAEALRLELPRLTSRERIKLGLSCVMSGIGKPALLTRRMLPVDLDALMALRRLRVSDDAARVTVCTPPLIEKTPEKLQLLHELARRRFVNPGGLLHRYACLASRTIVRWEGLEELPEDAGPLKLLGIGVTGVDMMLQLQGLRLGIPGRVQALAELEAAQVIESVRGGRWVRYRAGCAELTDEEEQFRSRLLFLSNLNLTVIQRFLGTPGHLKFMGFIAAAEDRLGMSERMGQGLWEKLQALRVPFWKIKPGEESKLTCVTVGVTVGIRYGERATAQPYLTEELLVTVLADLAERLGEGPDCRPFLQRMLLDRVLEEAKQEGLNLAGQRRQARERLGVNRNTITRWSREASCETGDIQRPFAKNVLPELVLKLFSLVQERWPKGLKVQELREHAISAGWPLPMQRAENIALACEHLVSLHLAAGYSEQQGVGGPYLKAYQALRVQTALEPRERPEPKDVTRRLLQFYELLCYPEGGEQPRFYTHQAIIRRDSLPELEAHLQAMRKEELGRVDGKYVNSKEALSPEGDVADSIMVIQCSSRAIGLKLPNRRYT